MAFTMRGCNKVVVISGPSIDSSESPFFPEPDDFGPVCQPPAASAEEAASSLSARLRRHLRDGTIVCVMMQMLLLLCVALVAGCSGGGGGYAGTGTVSFSAQSAKVDAGQSVRAQASVPNGSSLTFTLSGANCSGSACGTLSGATGDSVTYTAPATLSAPLQATLTAAVPGTSDSSSMTITANPALTPPPNPPSAVLGTAYTGSLAAGGGTTPIAYSIKSGSLPAGLALDSSTGAVTGTPTATGSSSFVVEATDSSSTPATVDSATQIVVTPVGAALAVVGGNQPSGVIGVPYTTNLVASGGTSPYTWSVTGGSLPAGLSLANSGTISGTPTATGTSTFTAQVQDSTGAIANGPFSISIAPTAGGAVPVITVSALPTGMVGQPYNATIGVDGGTAPYNCSVTAGTLPAGLTLGDNCVVSGTPTSAGTAALTIQATDSSSPAQTASAPVSLTIAPAGLSLPAITLPSATVGTPYSAAIPVTGGIAPYTCSLSNGALPAGLGLGGDCVVSGTPTTAGTSNATITATDSGTPAQSISAPITLTVSGSGLSLTTPTLPSGTSGTPYSASVGVTGGTAPYSCSVASGTLPAGLSFGANCAVTGTPTLASTTHITVRAADSSTPALSTTSPVSVTIASPAALTITPPPAATAGTPYTGNIGVSGGTAPYSCSVTGAVPTGLTLAANCQLTGTPAASGTASLDVQATDSSSPARTATNAVALTVNPATSTLSLSSPATATVDAPYTGAIGISGGTPPYTCSLTSGALPAGLSLAPDCAVTGTPTTSGTASVTVAAADSATPQDTTTAAVAVNVQPIQAMALTGSLPNATIGQAYNQTLSATGGVGPYTYAVTAGTLPAGLTLASDGTLSGTPTTPGAASVTVTASDSEGTPQTATLPALLQVVYPSTASDAELTGPYAFLFQGYDDAAAGVAAYQTAAVGSFTADGAGGLGAGELDANHQTSNPTANTVSTQNVVGTYTVGTDGRGTLVLTPLNADGTAAAPNTYAIALQTPAAPATASAQASMIESDSNQAAGTRGSGTLYLQTPSGFANGLSGSYAFGLSGDTPCLPTCTADLTAGPAVAVGQFTTDSAGSITGGEADVNLAATNYPNAALSGTYTAPDGNGRVQLSMVNASLAADTYPADYAAYMIDGTRALVMSTDKHSAYVLQAGTAQQQAGTSVQQAQPAFSNASLTGSFVGYENTPVDPGLVGQTLQNVLNLATATVFQGSDSGSGTCTLNHVDVGGVTGLINTLTGLGGIGSTLSGLLGSYSATGSAACTVTANGRAVLDYPAPSTGSTPSPRVAYLYNNNAGYFLETGYAALGTLANQTGAPYSLSTLDGTYVEATIPAASAASVNTSGTFTADGAGTATTTLDQNVGVGVVNVIQLGNTGTATYTLTDPSAGRFVLSDDQVIYAISPSQFVMLDTNPTSTAASAALLY